MSLREEKKAATRRAISEAAAALLLEEGEDAATVARVSERAGVSARTFHNYFADIDEALVEFLRKVFATIADQIDAMPTEISSAEVMEAIIIDALNEDGFDLYSASTLVLLGDRARQEAKTPPTEEAMNELAAPLVASLRRRTPGATRFDAEVLLSAYGMAGATAVKAYLALPQPRDPEDGRALVRRAFEVLRDMR
ncbi:TetR/AcrR family transcriptional regulator [Corynebacterium lujinxingii]|uniref:TetR/AcrR family transcriptional regulator n=1 Tax=Corynebacterium lujinxingii TaxID=2763010 RepID=A0A7H0K0K9_9CORY|nr:TetR/AcrR family transcriptional regulator [Corynebacterium lujinxingii]MBC3179431.1 TetR/AcrR family transcriptional regulator [Corynebacterium lujinxingii]NNO11536.1 TetR family transcriptional regulator [Corynebacterium lujinxingii]QNP90825.1 TetR/AcrR family transcriptional regulator [Corynebacterium lujinxingii]